MNTSQSDAIICSVCGKQKHSLTPRKSKLVGSQLLLCEVCKNKEPRWAIILRARRDGNLNAVTPYVKAGLYEGAPILLADLIE